MLRWVLGTILVPPAAEKPMSFGDLFFHKPQPVLKDRPQITRATRAETGEAGPCLCTPLTDVQAAGNIRSQRCSDVARKRLPAPESEIPHPGLSLRELSFAGGVVRVGPVGVVGKLTFEILRRCVQTNGKKGARFLVFDAERVPHINSTGLGFLVNTSEELAASGGRIVMFEVSPNVKVFFTMPGLDSLIPLVWTEED